MQATALALQMNHTIDMWTNEEKLKQIRPMVSQGEQLSDMEFSFLVELGRATQLNPFMKEIWAVKYSPKAAAQIFIGRDGYRKTAQRQPDYEYHQVNAVYSKDEFRIVNDEVQHNYGFSNRGELIGAYCIVKRKSSSRPTYVMVTMTEYGQNQSVWKSKPETMIKKVAEAQALRQAFQEALAGTYSEAELPPQQQHCAQSPSGSTQTERLINLLKEREEKTSNVFEIVNVIDDPAATELQIDIIIELIDDLQFPPERLQKAFTHYNVKDIHELTVDQADEFIGHLKSYLDKLTTQGNTNANE